MSSPLQNNITKLQDLLEAVNALPEAGGVELPKLSNEGATSDLLINKELINQEGNIVIGTMPDNGAISSTIDGINTKSINIPSGYTSGGTVSLTDDIDNEVDTQADLIAQIQSALEWKGGNGGIKTCTVTLSSFTEIYHVSYTAFEDNKIVAKCINAKGTTHTLNNVVCESAISFFNNYQFNGFTHSHDSSFIAHMAFHIYTLKAPSEANVNATITIFDDD